MRSILVVVIRGHQQLWVLEREGGGDYIHTYTYIYIYLCGHLGKAFTW